MLASEESIIPNYSGNKVCLIPIMIDLTSDRCWDSLPASVAEDAGVRRTYQRRRPLPLLPAQHRPLASRRLLQVLAGDLAQLHPAVEISSDPAR